MGVVGICSQTRCGGCTVCQKSGQVCSARDSSARTRLGRRSDYHGKRGASTLNGRLLCATRVMDSRCTAVLSDSVWRSWVRSQ
jgi:hypothetical protein